MIHRYLLVLLAVIYAYPFYLLGRLLAAAWFALKQGWVDGLEEGL